MTNKKTKKRILVTSALPYANGPLHVGHMVEYIQTDIFVRFLRLIGEDVIYCCADDTHGAPIEIKAAELKITPEQLIAKFHKEHQDDFNAFLVKFDSYYTTNSEENKEYSDLFFAKLKEKKYIYKKEIEVTFCEKCSRSLPDRYVKGKCPKCGAEDQYGDVCEACNAAYKTIDLVDPYCAICKSRPVRKTSEHYFFKLSAFSDKLKKWLKANKNLQKEIVNFVNNWIKGGLEDWNISRDGPYFGFKIPGEENKYYYVWLDAPIGYIASNQNYCKRHNLDAIKDYWKSKNSKIIHFIGKDITYFHFLFWPAMLDGVGFNLPDNIPVHGFLTVNNEKMSKSRGTFFTAKEFSELHNPEYLRYYYASHLSKKLADIDLDLDDFDNRVNNELVANLGNFCYRVTNFCNKNFNSEIKGIDNNKELINKINNKIKKIKKHYTDLEFNEAVKELMSISSLGNKYFQDNEPWKLIKLSNESEKDLENSKNFLKEDKDKAHKIVGTCINIAKNLSIITQPILPNFSSELQKQLNVKNLKWSDINFNLKNHKISEAKILIKKVEKAKQEEFPLNLKIAKVIDVKDHPKADKLYVLQIGLGTEKRQLVAGLKGYYKKEEILNKKIVVVINLKKAKLRGIESNGMLLAAEDNKKNVGLLTADKSNPGDIASFGNLKNSNKQLSFDDFLKIKMVVKDKKIIFDDKELKTDTELISAEKVEDGAEVR